MVLIWINPPRFHIYILLWKRNRSRESQKREQKQDSLEIKNGSIRSETCRQRSRYGMTNQEYQHIELRNLTSHTNLNNLAWQQHINNTNSYRKVHKI